MGTFETGEGERMPDYDDEEGMDELMSHIEAAEAMEASRRAEVEARQQVDMAPREADDEDAANIAAAIDPPEPLLMPRLVVPVDLPEEPPVEVANPAANAEGEEERDDLFLLDDIDGLLGAVGLRGPCVVAAPFTDPSLAHRIHTASTASSPVRVSSCCSSLSFLSPSSSVRIRSVDWA